ncbi:hypothetical protein EGP95_06455 [bacterium]|nr:hypothetical protein [bacterium]
MKIIKSGNAIKGANSDKCKTLEYPFDDQEIDLGVAEITGRYPDADYCVNLISKELIYVLDGMGKLCFEDKNINFSKVDSILIDKNEKYYWETDYCKVSMNCTLAWTEEQHRLVK